jgi:hypothetical protein
MSGGHGMHVIDFAAGCFFAVKIFAIPAADSALGSCGGATDYVAKRNRKKNKPA